MKGMNGAPLKTVFIHDTVAREGAAHSEESSNIPELLVHDNLNQLTICQRAVVGLRVEVNFYHLAPPSCDQNTVQLFCVLSPPVCVDSSCHTTAVDNVEVRGTKVESGLCVRYKLFCSIWAWVSPLVQVVNLEVEVRGQVGRAHLGCNIHSDNFTPWVGVRNFDRPGCRAEPAVEDAP